MRRLATLVRIGASAAAVAVVTVLLLRLEVNQTTVALSYLVVILSVATGWGIAEATAASILAMLSLNFFFLPPAGTLTIADPQNWVALAAFLVTAVVTSQLSSRARQRTLDALERQRDLERLYALSRSLLLSDHTDTSTSSVAQRIAEAFELEAVAVYDARRDVVLRGGGDIAHVDARLREVARQAVTLGVSGATVVAVRLGGSPIGSLAVQGSELGDTVLQSVANLVAIALERDHGRQATARAEAARQSGELRATVLDALAHEFKTPLTSLKIAVSDLQAADERAPRDRELLTIVQEDVSRLEDLVSDSVQMLRIDAGDFVVRRQRHRLADVVRVTLTHASRRVDGHRLVNAVPDDLHVFADADLLGLALRQLVDNAIKYSPPSSTIEVSARQDGDVTIAVRNTGSTIPPAEIEKLFERFYRGSTARHVPGTGIGLSIVQQIARAHGGTLRVTSQVDSGTRFDLSIPGEVKA